MTSKIKNILIFTSIAVVLVLIYIFFLKPSPEEPNLISSPSSTTTLPNIDGSLSPSRTSEADSVSADFLILLQNIHKITLDDSIFSDPVFMSLYDSSIVLVPDGTQGRPNPFAQFGNDPITIIVPEVSTCELPQVLDPTTNTCVDQIPVSN